MNLETQSIVVASISILLAIVAVVTVYKKGATLPVGTLPDTLTAQIRSSLFHILDTDNRFRHWQQWGIVLVQATQTTNLILVHIDALKPNLVRGVDGLTMALLEEALTIYCKKKVSITVKQHDPWTT